jgi:CheY-like chemotaxis protein
VASEPSASPSRQDRPARGQQLLAELAALHEGMARDLADQLAALTQARDELSHARSELTQGRAQQGQLQQELVASRKAVLGWAAERENLAADAERLRKAHDAISADNQALQARIKAQEAQLTTLHEEREQLSALYTNVTNQTKRLAADWSVRRDGLTADKQRLAAELEEARTTLTLSQERDRQWKAQVWKLQDEVKTLRTGAGRVTLTPEQSHHVYSQLNAIVGFAEVLLDEAGNRASGVERQEFLEHIKASGVQLVGYMNRLTVAPGDAGPVGESAGDRVLASPPGASAVLVAAADATVRERLEALLSRAGYRVEFAADAAEGLKRAVELQPLAIVIDTDLPPKGAQKLVDDLSGEPRARDIPVVLTAKNDEEQLGVSMGQVDFLKKPLNRQQVLQVMAKYDLLADRRRAQKMPTSVLVIDDDPRNTRLVQAMLKPFSIDVLSTNDGAAGIKLARTRKPDLIILDLMMPEVDGFEVVSAIRAEAATAEIPILIYTAKNITLADRQRLQSSIQAIIRKGDLSKEQFLDLIYRRGERRRRPRADEAAA